MKHAVLLTVSKLIGLGKALKHHVWALCCWDCQANSSCLWSYNTNIGFQSIYVTTIWLNTKALFGIQFEPNRLFGTALILSSFVW